MRCCLRNRASCVPLCGFGFETRLAAVFLQHFDPADISPESMVDREVDVDWVEGNFAAYLDAIEQGTVDVLSRRVVAVTGDKGIGKSILAQKVVSRLRARYSSSTFFVQVDCRGATGARGVIASVARGLTSEVTEFLRLQKLAPASASLPVGMAEAISVLSTVAHADEASARNLHQQLVAFKEAVKFGGSGMLTLLKAEFDISLERKREQIDALEAKVVFDVDRLVRLTLKLFEDIRKAGYRIFLLIDNLDELQHEYWDDGLRTTALATVKSVLRLTEGPVAMLLCMRTYFQSVLPRVVSVPRRLMPLPPPILRDIVNGRIARESEGVRRELGHDRAKLVLDGLAARAPTPLALINWVRWVAESPRPFDTSVDEHARSWRDMRYAEYARAIAATLNLFRTRKAEGDESITAVDLLAALKDDKDALRYLQTTELVLPRDFWNPTHFVLDPTAAWIVDPSR